MHLWSLSELWDFVLSMETKSILFDDPEKEGQRFWNGTVYWSAGRTFAVKFVTEPHNGLPLDDIEKTWYEVAPVKYEYLIGLTGDDDGDGR